MPMIKKLAKYLKGLWHLCIISAAGMITEAICELAMPSIANRIYNEVDGAAAGDPVDLADDFFLLQDVLNDSFCVHAACSFLF